MKRDNLIKEIKQVEFEIEMELNEKKKTILNEKLKNLKEKLEDMKKPSVLKQIKIVQNLLKESDRRESS